MKLNGDNLMGYQADDAEPAGLAEHTVECESAGPTMVDESIFRM